MKGVKLKLLNLLPIAAILLFLPENIYSQFVEEWSSPSYTNDIQAGWLTIFTLNNYTGFQKYRFYEKDQDKIEYMHEGGYDLSPEYTYSFTQEEKNANRNIQPIYYDFTGDGFPEFYIIRYYGTTNYRRGFRIFNLVNSQTLIEFNDASFSFDYGGIMDVDSDGILELIVRRSTYPDNDYMLYISYNTGVSTGGIDPEQQMPKEFLLEQNFPNPFNSQTNIHYSLSEASSVELIIYDIMGSIVKRITNEFQLPGEYSALWDGKNEFGISVSSGTYFYELKTDGIQKAKKMIMLK